MKFTFLLLIFSFAAFSQDLELVKNISSGTEGIEILRKHFDGENLFFVSKDNSNIQTLWFFNKAQNSLTSLFTDFSPKTLRNFSRASLTSSSLHRPSGRKVSSIFKFA
jgi:hypothetical protein